MNPHETSTSRQVARTLALLSYTQRDILRLRLVAHLAVHETAVQGATRDEMATAADRTLRFITEQLILRATSAPSDRPRGDG